jgi:hypothetical protein
MTDFIVMAVIPAAEGCVCMQEIPVLLYPAVRSWMSAVLPKMLMATESRTVKITVLK